MSIKSWREEFYPITGKKAAQQGTLASLKHGLKKWQGITVENRNKHNVFRSGTVSMLDREDYDGNTESFEFGWHECGLCWIYNNSTGPLRRDTREGCPISRVGEKGELVTCLHPESGYCLFRSGRAGPEVLISELAQALESWQAQYGETVTEENKYGSARSANPDWAEKAPNG